MAGWDGAPAGYWARRHDTEDRLKAALAPETAAEQSVVRWLLGWEIETIEALLSMVERCAEEGRA